MDPLKHARRIVVKVGSALLVGEDGRVDSAWLARLAGEIAALRSEGRQVLAVSSGAVALGRRRLGLAAGPLELAEKQAAAAAGQSLLMRAWEAALEPHGAAVAQVLLTRDDTEVRRRWLNARATVATLLQLGAVPVANENDTVATEEIRYGDNDRLAARLAQMSGADALVLLSDIDGLYTADPRRDPAARHVPVLSKITPEVEAMAGGANAAAAVGSGGMATKLSAASIAQSAGCRTVIAAGRAAGGQGPLAFVRGGGRCTVIEASTTPQAAYKAWIAGSLAPQGVLRVDAGAARALAEGSSLLAAGVTSVEGGFGKGDAVLVQDEAGRILARGLARYDAGAIRRILGLRSEAIAAVLGEGARPVVVHRDDLAP